MNAANLFTSSVGKKFIMAITGLGLFAFVVAHLIGNLQIFLGPESINRYGHFLQSNMEIIWPARIGLLVLVALHIWSAVKLSAENRAARPQGYANKKVVAATYQSRTMLMSGLIVLAFIIYHLLHFTVQAQAINFTGRNFATLHDAQHRHDVFAMMVIGFQKPYVSAAYIVAMFLLFLHLSHGVAAMFQSLGFRTPGNAHIIAKAAEVGSWLIFVGYISIPFAIMCGYGNEYVQGVVK